MSENATSHSIIKALKGPSDPPIPGGPSKISIAQETWKSATVYFPNKDEVLVEWILNSFSKQKSKHEQAGVLYSSSYWLLLSDILSEHSSRPGTPWLAILLNRISVAPIVTSFFTGIPDEVLVNDILLVNSFAKCLSILWPISVIRMNLDSLADSFSSVLNCLHSLESLQQIPISILESALLISRSFRQSLGTVSSKKKASVAIEENLLLWIKLAASPVVRRPEHSVENILRSEIYNTGIEVLFSPEVLKSPHDPLMAILQKAFLPLTPLSQLSILPRLYRTYMEGMRKLRYTIFGSGSGQAQEQTVQNKLRNAGLLAFTICCKTIREYGDAIEVWQSIHGLLEALDEVKIIGLGTPESTRVLSEITLWTIRALTDSNPLSDTRPVEKLDVAIRILRALLRIDFELVRPLIREVLTGLSMINPSQQPSSLVLLREVLDFHSKTRSIPAYISTFIDVLSQANLLSLCTNHHADVQTVHRSIITGSLLSLRHLEDFSWAVKNFLTPGQVQQAIECVLEALRNSYIGRKLEGTSMNVDGNPHLKHQNSEGKHKRRAVEQDDSATVFALSYSVIARTITVILPSLPFSVLPPAILNSLKVKVDTFGDEALVKVMRTPPDASTVWEDQIILSSTLRIRHSLMTIRPLQPLRLCQERYVTKSFGNQPWENMLPELAVEMFRAFFDWNFSGSDTEENSAKIDLMLRYLNENLASTVCETVYGTALGWSGLSGTLDFSEAGGHCRAALAIWHLAVDRWLPLIDELASPSQLRALSELILVLQVSDPRSPATGLTAKAVLERATNNAFFWELPNLREALLLAMGKAMPVGSLDDVSKLANEICGRSKKSRTSWEQRQIMSAASVYELLLRAPREFLSKSQRSSFFHRGLVADMAIYLSGKRIADASPQIYFWPRVIIRAWLSATSDSVDILDLEYDRELYLEYLIKTEYRGNGMPHIRDVSSSLLASTLREAIRRALRGDDKQLVRLCHLLQDLIIDQAEPDSGQILLRFIDILLSETPPNERQRLVSTQAIELIHDRMENHRPTGLLQSNVEHDPNSLLTQLSVIRTWRSYLSLHRWFKKDSPVKQYGKSLISKVVELSNRNAESIELRQLSSEVFLLLVEELNFVGRPARKEHLELLAASYILLGRVSITDTFICDAALSRVARTLAIEDFAIPLGLITEALRKSLNSSKESQCAIHLSQVLTNNAPEGSSRLVQEHFEDCLQAFANSIFTPEEPAMGLAVLKFIANQCSERPASIRTLSNGIIWVILARFLTGASSHTSHTHHEIFSAIMDITGALIRLRRDLVQAALPHLVMILRLLVSALRSIRPQLGTKQTQLVSDTLSWWINVSEPLGSNEARAAGRLLTSLQTKTVPRTFKEKDKTETQRAESLAHPFSKHAPYVLLAYIEAMNHPLCMLPWAVRKELEPGLFALCDIMSEHGRDAIMVSALDAGGKVTLKELWREYEKQRYVGKG